MSDVNKKISLLDDIVKGLAPAPVTGNADYIPEKEQAPIVTTRLYLYYSGITTSPARRLPASIVPSRGRIFRRHGAFST